MNKCKGLTNFNSIHQLVRVQHEELDKLIKNCTIVMLLCTVFHHSHSLFTSIAKIMVNHSFQYLFNRAARIHTQRVPYLWHLKTRAFQSNQRIFSTKHFHLLF